MKTTLFVTSFVILTACSSGSSPPATTGESYAEGYSAFGRANAYDCSCWWSSYSYASEAACRTDRGVLAATTAQTTCLRDLGAGEYEIEAWQRCVADAQIAQANCYAAIGGCTPGTAWDACDTAFANASITCNAMACKSVSTSACAQERTSWTAKTSMCF